MTDIDHVIQDFASKLGPDHPSIERIKRLHNEITIRVNG